MTTTYYKWMLEGKISPVQGFKFPVKKGEWTPNAAPILCESGWHFNTRENILHWLPQSDTQAVLWEVEVRGDIVVGPDKSAATSMRLVRKVATPSDQLLREFACDLVEEACKSAELALKNIKGRKFKDIAKTSRDSIAAARASAEVTRRFSRGEATQDELSAAWSAAWSAASAATSAASAARSAAWSAATSAAWSAASAARSAASAAESAARSAAWSAARSAASAARSAAWSAATSAADEKHNDMFCVLLGV